ncbi:MAG: dihydropteroate synthase [Nannocystaceae bacterium]|nr:dihydropteroate synthase [bacterium]
MSAPQVRAPRWHHATGSLRLQPARVMAVLNVTPDSFHDGGAFTDGGGVDVPKVRAAAVAAIDAGAAILDVGGESTRPGADPIDARTERTRVVPAVEALAELGVPVSVDTRRASVAEAALGAGASIVNDVSGLQDPQMAAVVAQANAGLVIGHLRGDPRTMQRAIAFEDLLAEVATELEASMGRAAEAGVGAEHIVIDPGVGFGKTPEQSAGLVAASAWLQRRLSVPVMIGASRKSFIGAVVPSDTKDRLPGSIAAAVVAVQHGAAVVRVHDVAPTTQALAVADAIARAYRDLAGEAA